MNLTTAILFYFICPVFFLLHLLFIIIYFYPWECFCVLLTAKKPIIKWHLLIICFMFLLWPSNLLDCERGMESGEIFNGGVDQTLPRYRASMSPGRAWNFFFPTLHVIGKHNIFTYFFIFPISSYFPYLHISFICHHFSFIFLHIFYIFFLYLKCRALSPYKGFGTWKNSGFSPLYKL